jgi:hypothetical protein
VKFTDSREFGEDSLDKMYVLVRQGKLFKQVGQPSPPQPLQEGSSPWSYTDQAFPLADGNAFKLTPQSLVNLSEEFAA